MKKTTILLSMAGMSSMLLFSLCTPKPPEEPAATAEPAQPSFGGFESQVKWGEHLVALGGCDDCHSPKMMTEKGPAVDPNLRLSGHPAAMPPPEVDRKMIESNGYALTNPMMTAWVGPWGISYSANLTSDGTGVGNWTEENFIRALREGKMKGLENGRPMLPPMPWQSLRLFSDDEMKAILAYLKTVPAVNNIVPEPAPPVSAPM